MRFLLIGTHEALLRAVICVCSFSSLFSCLIASYQPKQTLVRCVYDHNEFPSLTLMLCNCCCYVSQGVDLLGGQEGSGLGHSSESQQNKKTFSHSDTQMLHKQSAQTELCVTCQLISTAAECKSTAGFTVMLRVCSFSLFPVCTGYCRHHQFPGDHAAHVSELQGETPSSTSAPLIHSVRLTKNTSGIITPHKSSSTGLHSGWTLITAAGGGEGLSAVMTHRELC